MSDIKQVLVMVMKFPDGKGGIHNPRKGKLISQGSHGTMETFRKRIVSAIMEEPIVSGSAVDVTIRLQPVEVLWLVNNHKKIAVQVDTEEELMALYEKAKTTNLTAEIIVDSGLTEFHGVATRTCLAIGPNEAEEIDKITGHLKLL